MDKNTPKTSIRKWTTAINVKKLLTQVNNLEQDKYTKKLTTEAYIKLMLYAQLHETEGLEAISDALLNADFQREVGFKSISASQLSRKNNEIDPSILASLFMDLVYQIRSYHGDRKSTRLNSSHVAIS